MHACPSKSTATCRYRTTYLDGRDLHVNPDLILPDLAQRLHGVADVVEIFDWSLQALIDVIDEVRSYLCKHGCLKWLRDNVLASFCLIFTRNFERFTNGRVYRLTDYLEFINNFTLRHFTHISIQCANFRLSKVLARWSHVEVAMCSKFC